MESAFSQKYPEILDRIADMQFKHSAETCVLDMSTIDGDAVNCWNFANRENGDRLTIADPPRHLAEMVGAQAVVTLQAGEGELTLPISDRVVVQPKLNFLIDHQGLPYVQLDEQGIWEAVSPGYLVWMLDKAMYNMVADYDPRTLPSVGEEGGIDLVDTPSMASYTLAAAALDGSMLGGENNEVAFFVGSIDQESSIPQPPNTFTMRLSERDHPEDETGFRRVLEASLQLTDPTEVVIKKIGSDEVIQRVTDDLDFVISRGGLVMWYQSVNDQGESQWRIGVPIAGDTDLKGYLRNIAE